MRKLNRIEQVFEQTTRNFPNSAALQFDDRKISYSQLNEKAEQLALRISSFYAGKDDLIAIVMDNSLEMIISILAVFKTGNGYVPIDPESPSKRIEFILSDARPVFILTTTQYVEKFDFAESTVLCIDQEKNPNFINLKPRNFRNIAYIIYTSGTTGWPKGVLIPHENVIDIFDSTTGLFRFNENDVWTLAHSLSFDFSVWELWGALFYGGKLIILSKNIVRSPQLLAHTIIDEKVTVLNQTPSSFSQLISKGFTKSSYIHNSLRYIIFGGESLKPGTIKYYYENLRNNLSHPKLINMYGITEITIHATYHEVDESYFDDKTYSNIGYALPNSTIHLLDDNRKKVKMGEVGELYIYGSRLADGYLNREDLTHERFIPDPFGEGLMYKTGDLGRFLPDGSIEYIGRSDEQVKIRGYRIELGEIEQTILKHPDVSDTAVTLFEDDSGRKQLVGYLVLKHKSDSESCVSSLKEHLATHLPSYMQLSHYITLESLPLTTNGKVDKKKLPQPSADTFIRTTHYQPPTNDIEQILAAIWEELLNVKPIGLLDNFFECGGDSIISIQVVSKAKQKGIQLTVQSIFDYPVLGELAKVASLIDPQNTQLISNVDIPINKPFSLTPIQKWFFEQPLNNHNNFCQTVHLKLHRKINPTTLKKALKELCIQHDALRLQFIQLKNGTFEQKFLSVEDHWNLIKDEILIEINSKNKSSYKQLTQTGLQKLDINQGKLLNSFLKESSSGQQDLIVVIHHLVVDGVSWRILLDDLWSIYNQLESGNKEFKLHHKTSPYSMWAKQLSEYAQSEVLSEEITYWEKLKNIEFEKIQEGNEQKSQAQEYHLTLDEETTNKLLYEVPKQTKSKVDEILLTAFVQAYQHVFKQKGVYLNLEGHGREESIAEGVDLSQTVGWFTSIYPAYLHIDSQEDTTQNLREIKHQLRQIPNKGVGFGILKYMKEDPITQHILPPQITFNYLGQWVSKFNQANFHGEIASIGLDDVGNNEKRVFDFEVNCFVTDNKLNIRIDQLYKSIDKKTLDFLQKYKSQLQILLEAEEYKSTITPYLPSDFPKISHDFFSTVQTIANKIGAIESIFPLSPLQKGFLIHSLKKRTTDEYCVQIVLEMEGELYIQTFRHAWEEVIRLTPALKMRFFSEGLLEPVQAFPLKPSKIYWKNIDFSSLDTIEHQYEQTQIYINKLREKRINIEGEDPNEFHLLHFKNNRFIFIWKHHHISLDGWSIHLILNDVLTCYSTLLNKQPLNLPFRRSPENFLAHLAQQNELSSLEFWNTYLDDFSEPSLLSEAVKVNINSHKAGYGEQIFPIPQSLMNNIKLLSQSHKVTLNSILQSIWSFILSHYCSREDILYGVVTSGRQGLISDIENMVGCFINTLPFRQKIDPSSTFAELCFKTQKTLSHCLSHGNVPLNKIQSQSDLKILFDTIFVFESYPELTPQSGDTSIRITKEYSIEKTEYPLTVAFINKTDAYLKLNYQENIFSQSFIKTIGNAFMNIMNEIQNDLDISLHDISLHDALEMKQILTSCNGPKKTLPEIKSFLSLFSEKVRAHPNTNAVIYGNESINYQKLDDLSNKIARSLKKLDLNQQPIALVEKNSIELIIMILGIFKSGSIYLPIDPTLPSQRISQILEESNCTAILTKSYCSNFSHKKVLKYEDLINLKDQSDCAIDNILDAHDIAYVIYTSGSTGNPKGVMINHLSLLNLLLSMQDLYSFSPCESFLLNTTISFDPSIWQILWPLINGGNLILTDNENLHDPETLCELVQKYKIKVFHAGPSLVKSITNSPNVSNCSTLELIIGGGEPWTKNVITNLNKKLPHTKIINVYGPTEACIHVTTCQLDKNTDIISIGTPIQNSSIYILNHMNKLLPHEGIGEIYIGGICVADGYLNREDLTHERFIPDPFGEGLMYKTGDLGRFLPDGSIEYIGRSDEQVKIRGYRIELGEIEQTILKHPDVSDTAVTLFEDDSGRKQLVGYLVLKHKSDSESCVSSLKEHLATHLPSYMQLSHYITLESLPLTTNGKVDKKKLPQPSADTFIRTTHYQPPTNDIEQILAAIWEELLNVKPIGLLDNFFECGGDSIISIQVVSKAKQKGIQLTVQSIFDYPVLGELAKVASLIDPQNTQLISNVDIPINKPFSLTPIQKWFFEQPLNNHNNFCQTVHLKLHRKINPTTLKKALKELCIQHDALRLQFIQLKNGTFEQKFLSVEDHWNLIKDEILIEINSKNKSSYKQLTQTGLQKLDINQGKLLNSFLKESSSGQQDLIVVIHHLVVDGVSWRILLDDLWSIYNQLESGNKEFKLHHKTSPYSMWAKQLSEYAQSEVLSEEITYWEKLKNIEFEKIQEGNEQKSQAQEYHLTLDEETTNKLLYEVPKQTKSKVDEILLTAFVQAYQHVFKQKGVYLNLEGHGREESIAEGVDLSQTVGWFTSIYPAYLHIDSQEDTTQNLREIKHQLRQIPNKGVGFGILKYMKEDPITQHILPPQITFNYLGQWAFEKSTDYEVLVNISGSTLIELDYLSTPCEVDIEVSEKELSIRIKSNNDFFLDKLSNFSFHFGEAIKALCNSNWSKESFFDKDITTKKYPLTPLQEGLFSFHKINPASDKYLIQNIIEIKGLLNKSALKKAWENVVQTHSALQARFYYNHDESTKVYQTFFYEGIDWREINLNNLPPARQEVAYSEIKENDRSEGTNFADSIPLRFTLIECSASKYRLIWTFHQILLDGWSLHIILKDLCRYYNDLVLANTSKLSKSPSFSRYLEWSSKNNLHSQSLDFWKVKLNELNEPTRIAQSDQSSFHKSSYSQESLIIPKSLLANLQRTSRGNQVTLNTLFQSAWALLLSLYTQQETISFGVTVSGRNVECDDVDEMAGLFINTLPLILTLDANKSVAENFRYVQKEMLQLQQNSTISLSQLQGLSKLPYSESLFDHIIVFENYPKNDASSHFKDISFESIEHAEKTEFPLSITVLPGEEYLINFSYYNDHFPNEFVKNLMERFLIILENVTQDSNNNLGNFSFTNKTEKQLLLNQWSVGSASFEVTNLLHELVELQAYERPNSVAVLWKNVSISFSELNSKANQIARFLLKKGIQKGAIISFYLPSPVDSIATMLASLKLGCCYVPLDPRYPKERLKFMLEDSESSLLIQNSSFELLSIENEGLKTIYLDQVDSEISEEETNNLSLEVNPKDLAYIIYTSGSTGQPKGVLIENEGLANEVLWLQKKINLLPNLDKVIHHSAVSFDISVWEIWWPLSCGVPVVCLDVDQNKDHQEMLKLIQEKNVTVLGLMASLLEVLLEFPNSEKCLKSLRHILTGVEPLSLSLRKSVYTNTRAILHHLYGPTECTVDATYHLCSPKDDRQSVPIGRPMSNMKTYILDQHLRLLPPGFVGELHVAGCGIARGYKGRQELTQESFVQNPFADIGYERLYRTGDLAKHDTDGELHYCGRKDHQVKIRGFRIELKEIEVVLKEVDGVSECAVIVFEKNKIKSLYAFITISHSQLSKSSLINNINNQLAEKLPPYMLPKDIFILDTFDYTPSGKIDKKHLLTKIQNTSVLTDPTQNLPRTDIEKSLALIWSEALGVEINNININFFSIGGNSLEAMKLASLCSKHLDRNISVRQIFENPTINQLAKIISENTKAATFVVKKQKSNDYMPLSFAQERIWLMYYLSENKSIYNLPMAWTIHGKLSLEILQESLNRVIQKHSILRTSFHYMDNKVYQKVNKPSLLRIKEVSVEGKTRDEKFNNVKKLIRESLLKEFDLEQPSLVEATVFLLKKDECIFYLKTHHIIIDGWSTKLLLEELNREYSSIVEGKPYKPSQYTFQYYDFVLSQRSWEQKNLFEEQKNYWLSKLDDAPARTSFPRDNTRQDQLPEYAGKILNCKIPKAIVDSFKNIVALDNSLTLHNLLFSVFNILLNRLTEQDDLVVGTVVANRHYPQVDKVFGVFPNLLAIRTKLDTNETFRDLLDKVKNNLLNAYENQDIPFESLIDQLSLSRTPNQQPLFQTLFIFQDENIPNFKLPNLSISHLELHNHISLYDLTLYANIEADDIDLRFEYAENNYTHDKIKTIADVYIHLCEELCKNQNARINQQTLLPSSRIEDYFDRAFSERKYYDLNTSVFQLIESACTKYTNSVALNYNGKSYTYSQLMSEVLYCSNLLASYQVTKGSFVIICLSRSEKLFFSLISLLRLGACYIPLDPEYPADYIKFILEDSKPTAIITDNKHAFLFDGCKRDIQVINLDDIKPAKVKTYEYSAESPNTENPCYLIYTSGSSGTPKGVMISERNLLNFINSIQDVLKLQTSDHLLATTTVCFDISLLELILPIISGAQITLAPDSILKDPDKLLTLLKNKGINYMQATPSTWSTLLNGYLPQKTNFTALCGGEPLSSDLAVKLVETCKNVFNLYGPTETTIWSFCKKITDPKSVSLGKPLNNNFPFVLDKYQHFMPDGFDGELYIGGHNLAIGYHNRPDLTQEKFITISTHSKKERVYRTGDVVKYDFNDELHFVGRNDRQIKLRGHRIELNGIESALNSIENIKSAAVSVINDHSNSEKLIAFVVNHDGVLKGSKALDYVKQYKKLLSLSLPNYMVPDAFVFLDNLPTTNNNKIDYKKLNTPSNFFLVESNVYVPPQKETEYHLVKLFEALLSITKVSIYDDFFKIGGNSLQIVSLVNQIKREFKVIIKPVDVFLNPTVLALSKLIDKSKKRKANTFVFPLQKKGSESPFFFIHTDTGLAFAYQSLSYYIQDIPLYGINNPKAGDEKNAYKTIEEMARDYIKKIKEIQPNGPYRLAGLCIAGVIALEMAHQLKSKGEEVEIVVMIDSFKPRSFGDNKLSEEEEFDKIKSILQLRGVDLSQEEGRQFLFEAQNTAKIFSHYKPKSYPGRVALIKARELEDIYVGATDFEDPYNGWHGVLENLECYSIQGDHVSILTKENAEILAKIFYKILKNNYLTSLKESFALNRFYVDCFNAIRNKDDALLDFLIKFYSDQNNEHYEDTYKRVKKVCQS